jgi:arsenate reductase (thioredoxin)
MTSLRWLVLVFAIAAPLHAGAAAVDLFGQPQSTPRVLFMCPHGAAKSILASSYFEKLAKERGLNVRVDSAGTEPDAEISPKVAAHLKERGYPVRAAKPRRVTNADMADADLVISIGCDLSGVPAPSGELRRWDEVPALSDDFAKADAAILARVTALVDELARSTRRR